MKERSLFGFPEVQIDKRIRLNEVCRGQNVGRPSRLRDRERTQFEIRTVEEGGLTMRCVFRMTKEAYDLEERTGHPIEDFLDEDCFVQDDDYDCEEEEVEE